MLLFKLLETTDLYVIKFDLAALRFLIVYKLLITTTSAYVDAEDLMGTK